MTHLPVPVCVLGACLLWLAPPWTINHDAAWYLQMATQWLDGARLYRDVVDINPPLIVYLSAVPVALARWLGAPVAAVFAWCVLGWCWGCAALSARALRLGGGYDAGQRRTLIGVVLLVTTILPGRDFGQREHLLLAAVVAYVATFAARMRSGQVPTGIGITAGAIAGIAIALKPWFASVPMVLAVFAGVTRGPRTATSTENLTIAAVLALYAAHFALLPGDVVDGMVATFALAWQTYGAYDAELSALVTDPVVIECVILAAALVVAPRDGLAVAVGLCQVVLLVVGLAQQKGWSYHFLPASGLGWLLVACLAVRRSGLRTGVAVIALVCALVATLGIAPSGSLRIDKPGREQIGPAAALRALARGSRVVALDTSLHPWQPRVLIAGLRWGSRYGCLWPLPGGSAEVRKALRDALRAEWLAHPPALVIVPRSPLQHVRDADFDVLSWILSDADVARLWRRYDLVEETDEARIYRITE